MSDEENPSPPLLVKIQSVDISSLDFQNGSGNVGSSSTTSSKSRHVTYVETTNAFILVGSTSGTVYLFSRDNLGFILMIPFKGGKVCNIAVTPDESQVAVASIRGKVSIYRIHLLTNNLSRSSSSSVKTFKHLFDVPDHVNNEITEMRWSPNGKFLFVGDSQGIISQIDVASLQEFPRPPPSRVILKLQSRILQIDCTFPYLAVCTINATFLCDLDKEDFTRIQFITNVDIKASGVCIVSQPDKLFLLVGEVNTGHFYKCGMNGVVTSKVEVELFPGVQSSVGLFDPKVSQDPLPSLLGNNNEIGEINFSSPGKMFTTDDGQFIISVSSNKIFVYDSNTCQILLWNEDFNRINSLKIISNYIFLWYGTKLKVFALTQFYSYGKQLFKAGLLSVLQSWTNYAVCSVGCKNDNEEDNSSSIKLFRRMISPIEENDEFCDFIQTHISFPLLDPEIKRKLLEEETYDQKLKRLVNILQQNIKKVLAQENVQITEIFQTLQDFYTNLDCTQLFPAESSSSSSTSLVKCLRNLHTFLKQPQLQALKRDLARNYLESTILKGVSEPVVKYLQSYNNSKKDVEIDGSFLLNYAKSPLVLKYFQSLEIPSDVVVNDALMAEVIVLLLPITWDKLLFTFLKEEQLSTLSFFTWMIIMTFFSDKVHPLQFGGLLRTLQNPQFFDKLAEEIVSSVYREVIFPRENGDDLKTSTLYLTHFVTFTILFSKSKGISNSRDFSLVLNLFPLKRGVKKDLMEKIGQICAVNVTLFKMYYLACLQDGRGMKMCGCGIQSVYGSLEGIVPPFQRAVEEAVLNILVEQYFETYNQSTNNNSQDNGHLLQSSVHTFAIKRCLVQPYLESSVSDEILSDRMKITMLLRTGTCGGLQYLRFNLENLKVLREALNVKDIMKDCCSGCGSELTLGGSNNWRELSMDCVGVWMMENCGNVDKLMKIVKKMNLNSRGSFSLRFYQFLVKRDELRKNRKKDDRGFGDLVNFSSLTCSILH